MQREIAELLEQVAPPGSFADERSAPADALRIDLAAGGVEAARASAWPTASC